MVSPRWRKVLSDLWSNKTRTILVVLSIFIGVFSVGTITTSEVILERELRALYVQAKPATATIGLPDEDGFDDELVQTVRNMRSVGDAEGRRTYTARVKVGQDMWRDLRLIAIDDFDDIRVNLIYHERGAWPPDDKTILIERSAIRVANAGLGDQILIEEPDGDQRWLGISGVVHDLTQEPAFFSNTVYGYITLDTLEWLGEPRQFNEMLILSAENADDKAHNTRVAEEVYDKLRKSERDPSFPSVPEPGELPAQDFITGILMLMGALGVLAVFLSGFLVTNTISGLLTQQIKQIGVMKTIGARLEHIIVMYIVLVLCFGLLALAVATPMGYLCTVAFTTYMAGMLNFTISDFQPTPNVYIIQLFISIVVPVLASIFPIIGGTRITIREALSSESGSPVYGSGRFDRLINRIRNAPRPLLLSLRNTFRRKGRLAMTLITLTLGGAIFIAIASIQNSLLLTVDEILDSLFNYDVVMDFDRPYNADYIKNEAQRVPGVVAAETWNFRGVRRIRNDGTESLNVTLFAVPPTTDMIKPNLIAGRWLLPDDEQAVVISTGFQKSEEDIAVGDTIVLNVKGRETTWTVVGVMTAIGPARWAYANQDYFHRITREVGEATNVRIVTEHRTEAFQRAVANTLEDHFNRLGIETTSTGTTMESRQRFANQFAFITRSLLLVAVLIAIVGGLGLMGTMSMNVLERTREIGVMRAIGASDQAVLQIVTVEGMIIGIISWFLGVLISLPITRGLTAAVGQVFFQFPLSFAFSVSGALFWLVISVLLAALASFLPAWNASRLTVRDVLAYE